MSQSGEPEQPTADDPSLDQLADDLAGVEQALERLEDGSYWIDAVSGEPLTEDAADHRRPDGGAASLHRSCRAPPSSDPSP